jgi:hypothetical protein
MPTFIHDSLHKSAFAASNTSTIAASLFSYLDAEALGLALVVVGLVVHPAHLVQVVVASTLCNNDAKRNAASLLHYDF